MANPEGTLMPERILLLLAAFIVMAILVGQLIIAALAGQVWVWQEWPPL